MIDFRYHLVSIVAVFLALAIGIVIGATALQPQTASLLKNQLNSAVKDNNVERALNNELVNQVNADQAFAKAVSASVLGHLLDGQSVVIVAAPGADTTTIDGISAALGQSGATVTGKVYLAPQFLDTGVSTEQTLTNTVKRLVQVGVKLPGPVASGPVSGQQAAAQVLAAAITSKSGATTLTPTQSHDVLAELGSLGFVQVAGPHGGTALTGQATLAVVVVPANPPGNVNSTDNLALISLTQDLALASNGALMAGSVAGSGPGSAIQAVNNGSAGVAVTTVDDADTEIGQIVVIQALTNLLRSHASPASYGVGSGLAPSPAPTPIPAPTTSPTPAKKHGTRK